MPHLISIEPEWHSVRIRGSPVVQKGNKDKEISEIKKKSFTYIHIIECVDGNIFKGDSYICLHSYIHSFVLVFTDNVFLTC